MRHRRSDFHRPHGAASAAAAAAVVLILTGTVPASAGTTTALRINEVWSQSFQGPQEGFVQSRVELYNPGLTSEDADSLLLVNAAGTTLADLPAWSVPAAGFLTVVFGSGTDDSDFGDGAGTYFTQLDSIGIFAAGSDECAVYVGSVVSSRIADYVAWSRVGPYAGGFSALAAQTAAIWTANDFVDLSGQTLLSSFGLAPDGYDHETSTDWREYDWGTYFVGGGGTTAQNPVQSSPPHGTLLESGAPDLAWAAIAGADSFRLQASSDSTFATTTVSLDTTSTSFTVTGAIPDGLYWWRVQVYRGGALLPEHAVWQFAKLWSYSIPKTGSDGYDPRLGAVVPGLTPLIQHKDTRMLCIYNPSGAVRPGCDQTAAQPNGPWDNAHAQTVAHVPNCAHCSWYCTRAVIAMVNNRYGGDLSQDRVAYQLFTGAENGLGHDSGTSLAQRFPVYAWALGVAQNQITRVAGKPTFATIKAEVDAGRPIYIDGRDHATLLYGYADIIFVLPFPPFLILNIRVVAIANPWPGTRSLFLYNSWQPDGAGWGRGAHFLLPAAGIAARMQEAGVTGDADGDVIRDFDETNRFCSLPNRTDTDLDQIGDYREILSYTFHSVQHAHNTNAIGFSDLDGDGLRTECDCDADADADYDGGEDLDADGTNPEAGETDVYRPASLQLALAPNLVGCGGGTFQPQPTGGTLHANDTFGVDVTAANPCVPPAAGAALGVAGLVSTDGSGNLSASQFACYGAGTYRMVIDAIPNGVFDPGCDPVICFTIAPVPVGVEELAAASAGGRVRLAWRLSEDARRDLAGVAVERAEAVEGPWMRLTSTPLAPAASMEFVDVDVETGREFFYRLVLQPRDGEPFVAGPVQVTVMGGRVETALQVPAPATGPEPVEIRYAIGRSETPVRLELFDVRGRRLRTLAAGPHAAGRFTSRWDRRDEHGRAVASGVYVVRLAAGERTLVRKLVLATN